MRLALGKITKQSQTTDCSTSLDARYLAVAMEPAGCTLGAGSVRMTFDSEDHYGTRAWQVHLFSRAVPVAGFFRPREAGTTWPKEADAQVLRRVQLTCCGIEMYGLVASCCSTDARVSLGITAGGYQTDCYKLLSSCILKSVLDKGEPAAR